MNLNKKVTLVVVLGVALSLVLPHVITLSTTHSLKETSKVESSKEKTKTNNDLLAMNSKKDTAVPTETEETPVIEQNEEVKEPVQIEQTPPPAPEPVIIPYDEMTDEDLINAITSGTYKLEYSALYNTVTNRMAKARGAIYYNNRKETYYSEKVLPGTTLNIPGRHVAEDGTIRDAEGYICVAANSSYLSKGTIVKTSLGPAKVYDSGCASGIIDLYTNW